MCGKGGLKEQNYFALGDVVFSLWLLMLLYEIRIQILPCGDLRELRNRHLGKDLHPIVAGWRDRLWNSFETLLASPP